MEYLTFEFHYGGKFVYAPNMQYVGGEKEVMKDFDVDFLSIMHLAKDLQSKGHLNIDCFWTKFSTQSFEDAMILKDDNDVRNIINQALAKSDSVLQIFVNHVNDNLILEENEYILQLMDVPLSKEFGEGGGKRKGHVSHTKAKEKISATDDNEVNLEGC